MLAESLGAQGFAKYFNFNQTYEGSKVSMNTDKTDL
jgi:hypothetical protein